MSTKPKSTLRLLVDTISSAVSRVEDQYEKAGLDFPSLNDPFNLTHPASTLLFKPEVAADVALVVAATEQLSATMRPPLLWMPFHSAFLNIQASPITDTIHD